MGRQTYFFPPAPSNLGTPLMPTQDTVSFSNLSNCIIVFDEWRECKKNCRNFEAAALPVQIFRLIYWINHSKMSEQGSWKWEHLGWLQKMTKHRVVQKGEVKYPLLGYTSPQLKNLGWSGPQFGQGKKRIWNLLSSPFLLLVNHRCLITFIEKWSIDLVYCETNTYHQLSNSWNQVPRQVLAKKAHSPEDRKKGNRHLWKGSAAWREEPGTTSSSLATDQVEADTRQLTNYLAYGAQLQ